MLTFREVTLGIQECKLDLRLLYPDRRSRDRFEKKWPEFAVSDSTHSEVFRREGSDKLVFLTESFIPRRLDNRPSVLLLLGNPASHSVVSGMCFAFEGNNREHRFWRALRKTGILVFSSDSLAPFLSEHERNRIKKEELYNLQYNSPFCIGIAVYFSMPSAASDPKWSGVAGLLRLFGRRALHAIAMEEEKRITGILQQFMINEGGIITFQRDAYERLRSPETSPYSIDLAKNGELRGEYKCNSRIYLVGAPPTRFLSSRKHQRSLTDYKDYLVAKLLH
ncbi:MAG: hypothetical protein ACETWR_01410 [Anaerolineae bacterium]